MDLTDEEQKATQRMNKGLASQEFEEDILIKELQKVLDIENLCSDSRETIEKVIKVLQ